MAGKKTTVKKKAAPATVAAPATLISVLVPERGRPKELRRLVQSLIDMALDDNRYEILIARDEDDPTTGDASQPFRVDIPPGIAVQSFLWPRPPTLGDKLNRLAGEAKGEILWFIANDYEMTTPGWPQKFRDAVATLPGSGIGVLFPHDDHHIDHAAFPILTRRMVGTAGFFMPPWFPYWFVDTWWDEVGIMLDVRREIDVTVRHQGERTKATAIVELDFWAGVFEETRPARLKQAIDMAALAYGGQSPAFNHAMAGLERRGAYCQTRVKHLRNPEFVKQWEATSLDDVSPQYDGVKAAALELMHSLNAAKPKRPKVALCIPSGRTWEGATGTDVAGLAAYSALCGINIMIANLQTSMISQSRNGTVELAMEENCDYLMWIDSDMRFPPDTLVKLLGHNKDIVGCTYNKRVAPFETLGKLKGDRPAPGVVLEGLHEAELLPGGLILVKADVYKKLGWPWYFETYRWPGETGLAAIKNLCRDYFYRVPSDAELASLDGTAFGDWIGQHYWLGDNAEDWKYWSEDHAFCRKARRNGYDIWADLTLTYSVKHLGVLEVTCERPSAAPAEVSVPAAAE